MWAVPLEVPPDSWPVGEDMRKRTSREWKGIVLEKELEYDFTPDVIDVLSDKT
jgi:hypothetical protein